MFRQRATADAMELVSRLLEYTPSLRQSPIDACAHHYFDELRDPATRLPTGRELPPLFNFTAAGTLSTFSELCFTTGVPRDLRIPSVVSKGSVGPPVLSKKIKLCPTFAATRRVF